MNAAEPLLFQGTLLNQQGGGVEGALIQRWQTDLDGNYLHPHPMAANAPESEAHAAIVSDFQYYGTDVTDPNGTFDFLTYRPGIYSARPYSHFHFMIWLDGDQTPALVTQFYFGDESPPFPDELHLDITQVDTALYNYGGYVNGTIVVADPSSTEEALLPASPTQPQGPFYPEIDFFSIGNDLTTTADDGVATEATSTTATEATAATTLATQSSTVRPTDTTPLPNDAPSPSAAPSVQPVPVASSSAAAWGCHRHGLESVWGVGLLVLHAFAR